MNYSTAIFLINSDVRAVAVSYEQDGEGKGVKPYYSFKTFDPDAAPGDYVVVPTGTRHNMTVARIEDVDLDVEVDSAVDMKWLVGRVDTAAYAAVVCQEADAIAKIKSAEKRARQDELRAKLLADNPELNTLANIGADAVAALPAE